MHGITLKDYTDLQKTNKKIFRMGGLAKVLYEIIVAQKAITTPVVEQQIQTPEGAPFFSSHNGFE